MIAPAPEPVTEPATKPALSRTALYESHRQSGGRLVPFAGWEMPVQYASVKSESLAVRQSCGVFDVGHMGQFDVSGPNVTEALNAVVSADWSKVGVGRAAYALLLNASGGVQDDVMGYRLAENHWLIVVNASRAVLDEAHLRALLPSSIQLRNRYDSQAMLAIQGPRAEEIVAPLCDFDLRAMKWRDVCEIRVLGAPAILARGGYTGSDGFEWMGDAQTAPLLWEKLLEAGAVPCGLGARDVTRLEAGLPLYGHELREEWTPQTSGCGFAVKMEKGPFFGRDALLQRRDTEIETRTIRGLQILDNAIAREGYAVTRDGVQIGFVTSGTLSPTLNAPIALALLPADLPLETPVEVVIRGQKHPARICAKPFVPLASRTVVSSKTEG